MRSVSFPISIPVNPLLLLPTCVVQKESSSCESVLKWCMLSKTSPSGNDEHMRIATMSHDGEYKWLERRVEATSMGAEQAPAEEETWGEGLSGSGHVCKSVSCYLLGGAAGMQRLQMRLPGSNGNRVLISSITTPDTLRAESTGWIKITMNETINGAKCWEGKTRRGRRV